MPQPLQLQSSKTSTVAPHEEHLFITNSFFHIYYPSFPKAQSSRKIVIIFQPHSSLLFFFIIIPISIQHVNNNKRAISTIVGVLFLKSSAKVTLNSYCALPKNIV